VLLIFVVVVVVVVVVRLNQSSFVMQVLWVNTHKSSVIKSLKRGNTLL
jgi:hypothetical protein